MKKIYYKIYFSLLLIEILCSITYLLIWIYGIDFRFLYKIPLVAYLLVLTIFHLKYTLRLHLLSYIIIGFFIFQLIRGLIINQAFSGSFFTHVYTGITPILAISFGIHFAKDFSKDLLEFIQKILKVGTVFSLLILVTYLYFYYFVGSIAYLGFAGASIIVVSYILSQKNYWLYLFFFGLILFSGKRSALVDTLMVSFAHFLGRLDARKTIFLLVFIVIVLSLIPLMENQIVFDRFNETLEFNMEDEDAAYKATSGRWQEIVSVSKEFNERPIKWLIGGGYGATYMYQDDLYGRDNSEKKHYTHFSPFAYTLVYGLPFALILYIIFTSIAIKARKLSNNFFYLAFIALITNSFFGSTLFIDSKPWLLLGILSVYFIDTNLYIFNYNK